MEECNREQEKKSSGEPEKRIQNEAKHYSMRGTPEIRVNPAYFQRRSLEAAKEEAVPGVQEPPAESPAAELTEIIEAEGAKAAPVEVRVDLDSEYFKWKAQEEKTKEPEAEERTEKKERKGLWGKKKTQE